MTEHSVPRIAAIGLVARELPRTVDFYRRLGCDLPTPTEADVGEEAHLECDLGGVRLMIDTEEVLEGFTEPDVDGAGRLALAALCASPAEVDRLHDELATVGAGSSVAPFDAPWGQRYATVLDPDGVHVDLFAPLV